MTGNQLPIDLPSELRNSIARCSTLPSLPAIALQVIDASKDPDIGLAEVSEIIRTDPALSLKLLKIANSPLYSLRRTIHNLREALTLLGLNAALTIALSFTLVKSLKDGQESSIQHDNYWKRSLLSAAIARHMGFKLGLSNLEDLFLAGLLQDIGILALECTDPDFYSSSETDSFDHASRVDYESKTIETDHSHVGAWLLQTWHLPEKLYLAVLNSHLKSSDEELSTKAKQFQKCINLSGSIADIWLNEDQAGTLKKNLQDIEDTLNINDEEFNEFIEDINNMIPDISNLFDITISGPNTRDRVLDEARELLLERNLQVIKQSEQDRRQLEALEEKAKDLEKETHYDALTGVYNRKYFEHILDEEYENANMNRWPLSLAFIDLDNFKQVNDNYGHIAGDQVLKEIASFINQHIRQTDIFARYGGDEFILLLPGSTNDVAKNMLSRILKKMRDENFKYLEVIKSKATLSIGLASHLDNHDFADVTALLQAADKALYKVKESGRDNIASY
jgi:diguanylate cyclase (GGDEF)-like protein